MGHMIARAFSGAVLVFLAATSGTVTASPIVIDQDNYHDVTPTGFGNSSFSDGQTFMATLPWLDQIDLWLFPTAGAVHVQLEVYEDNMLTGTLLGTSTVEQVTASQLYDFEFVLPVSVPTSTGLVFKIAPLENIVGLGFGGNYPDGTYVRGDTDMNAGDLAFRTWGHGDDPEPVPEPSTLLLFASGLAAIATRACRSRRAGSGQDA